jgi:hypothetical protein
MLHIQSHGVSDWSETVTVKTHCEEVDNPVEPKAALVLDTCMW